MQSNDISYDFTGKNFVVTGASSGIGRQIAADLAAANAKVLAIARREEELGELQKQYKDNIVTGICDVRQYDKLEECIKAFVTACGKLDGCVHVAGIIDITPLKSYDEASAKAIMDVSFWAGMKLLQLVTKVSYANRGTSNVLFASASASRGQKGFFAYSAAKAAVKVAVQSAAKEISAKQHRVNSISPGVVDTKMTTKYELVRDQSYIDQHLIGTGTTCDVSGVALFLLSSRSGWITGTDVVVDGGFLA